MGCGFSSLKGEDVPAVNNPPTTEIGEPARRVNTNFSTVDYDQDSRGRRMTEYAPDETVKPKPSRSRHSTTEPDQPSPQLGRAEDDGPAGPHGSETNTAANGELSAQHGPVTASYPHEVSRPQAADADGDFKLKPYQTLDGGDWDSTTVEAAQTRPHANGEPASQDPTSSLAKDEFATSNDPANPVNQESKHRNSKKHSSSDNETAGARKKSWLGQKYASYQQSKQGRGVQLSDEELKKYTGKDHAELKEWAKTHPGVAGNQGSGRIGTDSAMASSAPYVAG
ncbi:hypothetical protein A1O3_01556 [Capronia epimyces CBS 606.96]|uniref:Uncharacterized protein n=1 Tax=Capronia epimyces CBS 606.96 TaxID=1182542 RepID=W9YTK3_9EURO|nr:uncharacterized protein A1O3_01556 [Capronia epimyces CBS 606.96]EXJ93000.1 hypothetical protein A1O3_01556 [Capronia epimyces CBS 606.96]